MIIPTEIALAGAFLSQYRRSLRLVHVLFIPYLPVNDDLDVFE
jgi:hypothetical protein